MPDAELTNIQREYLRLTPESARAMTRAARSMPRGLTRTLSHFAPYPVVFEHGEGAHLFDVDGNRYVDLFNNGLSLIHGHAYRPIEEALLETLPRGSAWPGASDAQIEFAEMLVARVPEAEQVRFANTGTEAMMLAVKVARHVTGRRLIVKAWDAYHGSYDDLEVGLQNQGEIPGRVALATFGELETYEDIVRVHEGEIAAIVIEPVQYTGVVTPPPDADFLPRVCELAERAGALLVLDDCLMFRLAEGGSAERFGFRADITCLGKWIGGGLPVGVVAASAKVMSCFDLDPDDPLYHGGSFNGNLLGMTAGAVALRDFCAADIVRIDAQAERLKALVAAAGEANGWTVGTPGVGSAFGLYVLEGPGGAVDWPATRLLHLAAVTRGVYYGSGGEIGLSSATTDADVEYAAEAIAGALADLAKAESGRSGQPSV